MKLHKTFNSKPESLTRVPKEQENNMSATTEETKQETTQETTQEKELERGPSGEVGKPTVSLTLKQKWHEATHKRVDVGDKNNPRKRAWVKLPGTPSLKAFARQLAKSGNATAKDWFEVKSGALNESRSEKNKGRIALEKRASKDARRKKSAGKNKETTSATTTATTVETKGKRG